MTLYEEYLDRREKPPSDPAKVALFGIVADLTDRSGLDSAFDGIDDDIKDEMLEQWLMSIKASLPAQSVQRLKRMRGHMEAMCAECVDDPEEILTDLACDAPDNKEALDLVIMGFGFNE